MKYSKPHLSFENQAVYLLSRGLSADKTKLIKRLKQVNYYRLSGYWYPFLNSDDTFMPQTSIEMIWRRYTFDRELRLLLMDAIEKIEVTVRTRIVYYFSEKYGPFGYENRNNGSF
ncbi:MAG TPA: Abi family protein [bacterium]|nr:Abi family protein [bacterium]